MSDRDIYISRPVAKQFLDRFGKALKKPDSNPFLFYVCGIGGIGKSTLLDKLQEDYRQDAVFAKVFFGTTSKIDGPLALMERLYEQLPSNGWDADYFPELCQQYKDTLNKLQTEAVDRGAASQEQVNLVKKFLGGATERISSFFVQEKAAETLGDMTEGAVEFASLALSEKDRIEQILKTHRATKNQRELQELMRDPLPKLTAAFIDGLVQKSQEKPIVLVLDTYEKSASDFNLFLCRYILGDEKLRSHSVRMVMAGRYSLKNKRYQRMFQSYWNDIYERQLENFEKKETKEYLEKIGISKSNEIRRITQGKKGFPYFLQLIKTQKEEGQSLSFSRDSDEISDRLLDGLNEKERQVVRLAAYCRWFDRPLIQYLIDETKLEEKSESEERYRDWFAWLIGRDFIVRDDHFRLDDVARDVIRAAQHRQDAQNFCKIHDLLARYFEQLADKEVPRDRPVPAKYENSDWREHTTEKVYHALFAHRDRGQFHILTHFFEGAHFKQPDIAINALTAISSEMEPIEVMHSII